MYLQLQDVGYQVNALYESTMTVSDIKLSAIWHIHLSSSKICNQGPLPLEAAILSVEKDIQIALSRKFTLSVRVEP